MKRVLLFVFALVSTLQLSAQCSELFISGYVEGFGNNRALEIYNPTAGAIDLSGYSVGRFSNGQTQYEGIQLPAEMLQPYDVFVVVLDKRDSLGSGLEVPVWNGYQLWGVVIDEVTGDTVFDMNGDAVYDVQYDLNNNNIPFYGDVYNEWLDLEGKADAFLCPVYDINNSMYFNGNDAVTLISGTEVMPDGSNVIDVIGVIGEDPGSSWETSEGEWITRDKSLTRNPLIGSGSGIVAAALGDTIAYENWDISYKNDFNGIGAHVCICAGPLSAQELNQVPFKMFPNPLTANELTIEAAEPIEQVIIYNILGEAVFSSNLNGTDQSATLIIPNLSMGIYAVAILFEGN
ncbi:MAG: hypothetical protein ACI8X3_001665, partial [Saprospiraceae bacterium]